MLANELFREFFFSQHIPNVLDAVYGMTPEFKQELNKEYDIYTTNQLMAAYGKFNFQFPICEKLFRNTPEDFVELFFLKLKNQGIQIPPFQGRVNLFTPPTNSENGRSEDKPEATSPCFAKDCKNSMVFQVGRELPVVKGVPSVRVEGKSEQFMSNYVHSIDLILKDVVRGEVEICQGCGKIKLSLSNEPRYFGCYGCSPSPSPSSPSPSPSLNPSDDEDEDNEDEDLILDDEGENEEEIAYYLGE